MYNLQEMREFSTSQQIRDLNFRIHSLQKLKQNIIKHRSAIHRALYLDLGKSEMESEMTEIQMVINEIDLFTKYLKKWAKPKRVRTPLVHFYGKSRCYYENYGLVLLVAPWNYPFHLCFIPLVGAVAGGNTVFLKPSQKAKHAAKIIEEIVEETFDPRHVKAAWGGEVNPWVLKEKFDMIFFTGGTETGRKFYEKAAREMVPITLELGGKSPAVIHENTHWETTAQRILFGKLINSGQTCVAVDYCLCPSEKIEEFLSLLQKKSETFYPDPLNNTHYPKLISPEAYRQLATKLEQAGIPYRGDEEKQKIAPVFFKATEDGPFMDEEIFGPILPVIPYEREEEIFPLLRKMTPPLSLYIFSRDKAFQKRIREGIKYGGGCINDSLIHISNHRLPFGGFHQSGIGAYHGKKSFLTFTHEKSILEKRFFPEIKLRYPPFTEGKAELIRKIF